MNKLRELIEPGYIWANGKPMNEYTRASYNYVQGRINAAIKEGLPVSESLLNQSFSIANWHISGRL
mgnify:CR=1 FL=1